MGLGVGYRVTPEHVETSPMTTSNSFDPKVLFEQHPQTCQFSLIFVVSAPFVLDVLA